MSSQEVARTSFCGSLCDGLLEVVSPPTLGTTASGDDSSFELCAVAFLKDKEARENGVGIRSLIAAWSRARGGTDTSRVCDTPLVLPAASGNFLAALAVLPDTWQLPDAGRSEGRSRANIIIDGDTEWDTHWHPHTHTHTHPGTDAPTTLGRRLSREPVTRQSAC